MGEVGSRNPVALGTRCEFCMDAGWTNDETHALIGVWSEAEIQSQLDGVSRNRVIMREYLKSFESWATRRRGPNVEVK